MSFYIERKMAILAQRIKVSELEQTLARTWVGNPFVAKPEAVTAFNKGDYGRVIAAKEVKEALAEHRAKEASGPAEPDPYRGFKEGDLVEIIFDCWCIGLQATLSFQDTTGVKTIFLPGQTPRVPGAQMIAACWWGPLGGELRGCRPWWKVIRKIPSADTHLSLFGGGWTAHSPDDLIPPHSPNIEYLMHDVSLNGAFKPRLWRSVEPPPTQCWKHEPGFIKVIGWRMKSDAQMDLFGGGWTPYKPGDPIPTEQKGRTLEKLIAIKPQHPQRTPWVTPNRIGDFVWTQEGVEGANCENMVIGWRFK